MEDQRQGLLHRVEEALGAESERAVRRRKRPARSRRDAAKPGPKRAAKGKNGKEAKGAQKGQVAAEEAPPGPVQ